MNKKFLSRPLMALFFVCVCIGCGSKMDAAQPVAKLPQSPWVMDKVADNSAAQLYAGCASCHMADGSGRSDGLVPRLAGQDKAVLINKLNKLRNDQVNLPVMVPFAKALSAEEVVTVAGYIATLPGEVESSSESASGNNDYTRYCAGCHGMEAQGNAALLAPGLCHQHPRYIEKRLGEIKHNLRGDADAAMQALLKVVPKQAQTNIAQWLGQGQCFKAQQVAEINNEK